MSTGGGPRVSIPNSARKTIQNIKEITGNHSDEEIYAMLRECSMDPNETTQKLLLQDTFHEVRRRRDRRKEHANNKESADAGWRPETQGRGGRGGRGNYYSRHLSHDNAGVKNLTAGRGSVANQGPDKDFKTTSVVQNTETKPASVTSNSLYGTVNGPNSVIANGPSKLVHVVSPHVTALQAQGTSDSPSTEELPVAKPNKSSASPDNTITAVHEIISTKSGQAAVIGVSLGQSVGSVPLPPSSFKSVSGFASFSDLVLEPSHNYMTGAVGTIKGQMGSQKAIVEPTVNKAASLDAPGIDLQSSLGEKGTGETGSSRTYAKLPNKSQAHEINHSDESQARPTSSSTGTSGSRPPSNYSNRSQQLIGPQKVGQMKEWKPKQTTTNLVHSSETVGPSDAAPAAAKVDVNIQTSDETASKLQKKLEELHFSDGQHVIFPSHIQVPECERTVLSFGSFTASFGLNTRSSDGPEHEKTSTPLPEFSQEPKENLEEPSSSIENALLAAEEDDYSVQHQSPGQITKDPSPGTADISNISAEQEQDTSLEPEGPQYSVVQTAPTYSTFGLMPPMIGSPFSAFESSESQTCDASRLPSFVVQQPFDATASYYTQLYRPGADSDGRYSSFFPTGPTTKFPAPLSSQGDQSPQESGNSLAPASGPSPVVTQAAGVMQNSMAVTQQPVPVFRQPSGLHITHYPPNYVPYSHYLPPFYMSPPLHPFISNLAFTQQHPATAIYPPVAAVSPGVKYPLPQYKSGTNNAHSTHVGMTAGYGPYTSGPTGYSPSPAASIVNSTTNEDLTPSQYKESNMYLTGQQSEGSTVWIAPPRDVPGLQASSFYNLTPQGQHVTFTPTQAGHGAYPGLYHPSQMAAATVHPLLQQSQTVAGAVEMVGPQAGVYTPQRAPINWTNNY